MPLRKIAVILLLFRIVNRRVEGHETCAKCRAAINLFVPISVTLFQVDPLIFIEIAGYLQV